MSGVIIDQPISVAFVCSGNICRSPMAEAVFRQKVKDLGYSKHIERIDSFGTGPWHVGQSPDSRSAKTCRKHGVPVSHTAQQIKTADYGDFDYLIAMDEENRDDLMYRKPRDYQGKISLFGEWRSDKKYATIVDDPYYGGVDGFEINFQQISHFCENFLKREIGEL